MKKLLAILAAALALGGCASIVDGSRQSLTIQSDPPGALVTIDGEAMGKTPVVLQAKRKQNSKVILTLEGYKPKELPLATKTNGWFWGNIITGGTLGSSTDSSTGAIYEYSPDTYFVKLEK